MKNLRIISFKLNLLIFILIFVLYSQSILSTENRIIFKINGNAFTSLDLERRLQYLNFVGNNDNIDSNIIINDFISANLFYEYYKNLDIKENLEIKIQEIFEDILNTNEKNNKKYEYEINKNNILDNIKIDYVRKIILEDILNSSVNNINISEEEIDLLYNIKIKYINVKTKNIKNLKNKIKKLQNINFEVIINFLKINNFLYFSKEKEINNINYIDKRVKQNILTNKDYFFIEKDDSLSLIFIEKTFETLDGIIVNLFSVKTLNEINQNDLKCENLSKLQNSQNIVQKEYKMIDLNNELKNSLVKINDYVKYTSDNENIYIILCSIKFDIEMLNRIDFNKLINLNVSKIENKFIKKYSRIFNLIEFNE